MFGRKRRERLTNELADSWYKAAGENPGLWRMLELGVAEYTATRKIEWTEEFAAMSDEEQRPKLNRAFTELWAAVNEERVDEVRLQLDVCWVMVRGRRLSRARQVVTAFENAARAEGIAQGSAVSDFAGELDSLLDELASALEEEETLPPDDTVYRTFTLNENLMSLAVRHLQRQGTTDVLPLLAVTKDALLSLSQQTPSGNPLPNLNLEPI
jgi:hypothetical protein